MERERRARPLVLRLLSTQSVVKNARSITQSEVEGKGEMLMRSTKLRRLWIVSLFVWRVGARGPRSRWQDAQQAFKGARSLENDRGRFNPEGLPLPAEGCRAFSSGRLAWCASSPVLRLRHMVLRLTIPRSLMPPISEAAPTP